MSKMNREIIHNVDIRMSFNFATIKERQDGDLLSVKMIQTRIARCRAGTFQRVPSVTSAETKDQIKAYRKLIIKKRMKPSKLLPLPNTRCNREPIIFDTETWRAADSINYSENGTRSYNTLQMPSSITLTTPDSTAGVVLEEYPTRACSSSSGSSSMSGRADRSIDPKTFYGQSSREKVAKTRKPRYPVQTNIQRTLRRPSGLETIPESGTRFQSTPITADQLRLRAYFARFTDDYVRANSSSNDS